MIQNVAVSKIDGSNLPMDEAVKFKVKNTPKQFQILSNLYNNKVRAIVRELSCNARDSHFSAGKRDVPFEIHVPNAQEPYFEVRDYGTGLSHDEILNIYIVNFESTKEDENDSIGFFGIGSKSPLFYCDAFTITAIKDGEKNTYTVFEDEEGPKILRLSSEATEEGNGLSVIVPTKDHEQFYREIQSVFRSFETKPTILNSTLQILEHKIVEDKGFYFTVENLEEMLVLYGDVEYPVDPAKIADNLEYPILGTGVVFRMPLGTLSLNPSRESLNYTKRTKTNLSAQINKAIDAQKKVILEYFETSLASDDMWDFVGNLNSIRKDYTLNYGMTRFINQKIVAPFFTKNRAKITDVWANNWSMTSIDDIFRRPLKVSSLAGDITADTNLTAQVFKVYSDSWKNALPYERIATNQLDLNMFQKMKNVFFYDPEDFSDYTLRRRARLWVKENSGALFVVKEKEALKDILDHFPEINEVKVDDLPKPPKQQGKARAALNYKIKYFDGVDVKQTTVTHIDVAEMLDDYDHVGWFSRKSLDKSSPAFPIDLMRAARIDPERVLVVMVPDYEIVRKRFLSMAEGWESSKELFSRLRKQVIEENRSVLVTFARKRIIFRYMDEFSYDRRSLLSELDTHRANAESLRKMGELMGLEIVSKYARSLKRSIEFEVKMNDLYKNKKLSKPKSDSLITDLGFSGSQPEHGIADLLGMKSLKNRPSILTEDLHDSCYENLFPQLKEFGFDLPNVYGNFMKKYNEVPELITTLKSFHLYHKYGSEFEGI